LKKISVAGFYGIIAGLFLVLFTTGTYLAGVTVYMSRIVYLGYAVLILLAAAAALAAKKRNGGYLGMQAGVKTCFTVFVIGLAAQTLFIWVLLNILDTRFKQSVWLALVKNTGDVARRFGMPDDLVQKAIDDQQSHDPFTLGRMLTGLAFYLIVYFIISLLIAAIVKRKKNVN
jgi:hypothetical protein